MTKEHIEYLSSLQERVDKLEEEIKRLETCGPAVLEGQTDCTISFPLATIPFAVGNLISGITPRLYEQMLTELREELEKLTAERDRLTLCVTTTTGFVPVVTEEVN